MTSHRGAGALYTEDILTPSPMTPQDTQHAMEADVVTDVVADVTTDGVPWCAGYGC